MSDKKEKRAEAKAKLKEKLKKAGNALTNSKFFKEKVDAAWDACDADGSGYLNKEELYTGIVFLHLKLAENAGAAACHPPNRDVSDKLFEAADVDGSGKIDKEVFSDIVVILCGQLFKRMIAYYGFMIVLVPIMSVTIIKMTGRFTRFTPGKLAEKIAEHVTSGYLFTQVLPYFWNKIDSKAQKKVLDKAASKKKE